MDQATYGRTATVAARSGRTGSTEPRPGWHWAAWLSEFAGTALLLLGGLSAVFLDFGPSSPMADVVPSRSARFLLTGLLFAGTGSLVAISPLGRRSGAHLNPAVTVAFWTQHRVHRHDLAGYVVAQVLGAAAAAYLLLWSWGPTARALHDGATHPGNGLSPLAATAVEAVMTAVLVLVILVMTSSRRMGRWTPLAIWLVIAALVWQGAPYTGTSLNPARSIGPALAVNDWTDIWVYLVGPMAGAALAVGVFAVIKRVRRVEVLTAKLFHDERYPSSLGSLLPVALRERSEP